MPETRFPTLPPEGEHVNVPVNGVAVQVRQMEGTVDFLQEAPIIRAESEGGESFHVREGETYPFADPFNQLEVETPPGCPIVGNRIALEVYRQYDVEQEALPDLKAFEVQTVQAPDPSFETDLSFATTSYDGQSQSIAAVSGWEFMRPIKVTVETMNATSGLGDYDITLQYVINLSNTTVVTEIGSVTGQSGENVYNSAAPNGFPAVREATRILFVRSSALRVLVENSGLGEQGDSMDIRLEVVGIFDRTGRVPPPHANPTVFA